MPEENQSVPVPPVEQPQINLLDKNVPNPLAKNPNVHTHKVFASVGLVLIGVIAILGVLAYMYRSQLADYFNGNNSTASYSTIKVSTSSAKTATSSATKDETKDWQTYATKDFIFKYPNSFKIVNDAHGNTYVTNISDNLEVNGRVASDQDKPTSQTTNYTLGGKVAIRGQVSNAGRKTIAYYVDSVNLKVSGVNKFVLICAIPVEQSDSEKTCDLIASTFKFL